MAILISVIIPVYNHYKYLDKCLKSVLRQKLNNIEVICINDNSSDNRVYKYLEDINNEEENITICHNQENLGISKVLNKGVEITKGSYLAFVDCDDFLAPNALQIADSHISKYPEVDYFFSDRYDVNENNKIIRIALYGGYQNIFPSGDIKKDLLQGMIASHLKVIRKSIIEAVGGFDNSLNGVQDWDMALKVSELGKLFYINKPLYYHRIHSSSVTNLDASSQIRKTNIVRRKYYQRLYELSYSNNINANIINSIFFDETKEKGEVQSSSEISIYNPENISFQKLSNDRKTGKVCFFDARYEFDMSWINFLREYNSFFDKIICDDPKVIASLMGYVWDVNIFYGFTTLIMQ